MRKRFPGAKERPGPQFGTGRLGRDSISRSSQRERGRRLSGIDRRERRQERRENQANAGTDSSTESAAENGQSDAADARRIANRLRHKERHIARADRILAKRLADIDHLRDIALENGNLKLLDRADTLEELARKQHVERLSRHGSEMTTDGSVDGVQQAGHTIDGERPERSAFGRATSASARENGADFGKDTAERANTSPRKFGESIANGVRRALFFGNRKPTEQPEIPESPVPTTTPTPTPTEE
jgi:hypothetical protein